MTWFSDMPEVRRRVFSRGSRIDARLIMAYRRITKPHVRKSMGWSDYRYYGVVGRQIPIWPRERRELAEVLGVDPPTVLAVKIKAWDGRKGHHPPTGALV